MNKDRSGKLEETVTLFKKVAQAPDSVSNAEKKQIKKLVGNDYDLMVEALLRIQEEQNSGLCFEQPIPINDGGRTHEEIIAENYIALAKFAIKKYSLQNVEKLKVRETDCGFIIYALTPSPVELDLEQFATSDYPANKELLLEAEALQADLFAEDSTEKFKEQIIKLIENAVL